MRALLRDLLRQRLRTALTVSGIGLGILTLVVLGALGEHFRLLVEESKSYTSAMLLLFTKTNQEGVNPGITPEALDEVRALDGVVAVAPTLQLWFDGFDLQDDALGFLKPKPLVQGVPPRHAEDMRAVELTAGRWLREGDVRHAMIIDWLAERRGLEVGDEVTIRRQPYEVVGVYSAPDAALIPAGIVPYDHLSAEYQRPLVERAQAEFRALAERHPLGKMALAQQERPLDELARDFVEQQESLYRIYQVLPRDRSPAAIRELAGRLRETAPHLAVITPERLAEDMESAMAVFLVITGIVTALSTVVGGLLIANTMAMAVVERRQEIAIKASLGATPAQIAGEFVAEAALLGLLGAAIGLSLGTAAILLAEPWVVEQIETGRGLFRITPRLLLATTAYGVGIGVLAGGIPALRAARVDPAVTLREL